MAQLTRRRAGTAFLTLRDPDVDMSLSASPCPRACSTRWPPRWPRAPASSCTPSRRSTPSAARCRCAAAEIRPVGVGELLARLEHLKRRARRRGPVRRRPQAPAAVPARAVVGLVCGRACAAERDVVENARRRWPAVQFEIRAGRGAGPDAVPRSSPRSRARPRPRGRRDRRRPRRRLGRGPAAVLRRGAGPRRRRRAAPRSSARSATSPTPRCSTSSPTSAPPRPTDAAKRVVPDVAEERAASAPARRPAAPAPWPTARPASSRPGGAAQPAGAGRPDRLSTPSARSVDALRDARPPLAARRARGPRRRRARPPGRGSRAVPAATLERGYAVVQHADGGVVTDRRRRRGRGAAARRVAQATSASRSPSPGRIRRCRTHGPGDRPQSRRHDLCEPTPTESPTPSCPTSRRARS